MGSVSGGWATGVAFVLGSGVGFFAAVLLGEESPNAADMISEPAAIGQPTGEPHASASDPELARALRQLGDVLASLEDTIATRPTYVTAAPASDRSDAAPSLTSDAVLLQSFQEISASLKNLSRPGSGKATPGGPTGLVPPAWVDRNSAFGYFDIHALLSDEEGDIYDAAYDDFRKRHLFWSQQDVLTQYGKPDTIEAEGQVASWYYEDVRRIQGRGDIDVSFYFSDGLVYSGDIDLDHD